MKNWLKIPGIRTRHRTGGGGGGLLRRTFILFLLLISAGLMTSGALELFFRYRESLEVIGSLQQEMAQGAAFKIRQYIRDIEKTMRASTQTRENVSRGLSDAFRFPLLKLMKVSPAISTVAVYSMDGREILKESRIELVVSVKGDDHSGDKSYQTAREGRSYFGPVYFVRQSEPYMRIAVPLEWFQGQVEGVLVADVNLKHIWDVISRIRVGESGYAYVVSGNGDLIAYPDISLVLQRLNLRHLEHVKAALEGGSAALSTQPNLAGRNVFSTYAYIPELDWAVMVERPVSEAFAPLYGSLFRTALLLLVGLGMAVAASLIVGRNVLRPLEVLREGAERIGAGELRHRIDIRTGDELEALATDFNNMAGQLEAERLGLEQKVEERTDELTQSLEQQTAIGDILRVISTSPTELQSVFDTIIENACNLCHADFGMMLLYENPTYRVVSLKGIDETQFSQNEFQPHPESGMGRMIHELKPIQIADLKDTEGYRKGIPERVAAVDDWGVRSALNVPLLKENKLEGVVVIFRKYVKPFAQEHVDLVQTFADQAVIAIGNARLLEALQDRTDELSQSLEQQTAIGDILQVISTSTTDLTPVFDTILENACRLCHADFGMLLLYEKHKYRGVAFKGIPESTLENLSGLNLDKPHPGTGIGRMIHELKPIQIADIKDTDIYRQGTSGRNFLVDEIGVRTLLHVPLLKENQLIGVVLIYRKQVREFSQEHVDLVETFADQAVIAIGNARLLEALQDRTDELSKSVNELQALSEVGQAVSSILDLETVLTTIVTRAVELSGARGGLIFEFDEDASSFALTAAHGADPELISQLQSTNIQLGEGALGLAGQERRPVQVPDMDDEGAAVLPWVREIMVRNGYRSLLSVPLLQDRRIMGGLVVWRNQPGNMPEEVVRLLQSFATQSTLAIQNARLFHQIEERGRELEIASRHKSEFLANMSHELRTPLNAILGYTELVRDGIYGDLPEKVEDVMERVQKSGNHLLNLINDVLDLSKIEAGQLELSLGKYSMQDVVNNVFIAMESLAEEKKLHLTLDLPGDLPVGTGDEQRITQVLMNLAGNAIKFTESGTVGIRASAENGAFRVAVSDTGPGIPEEAREDIFDEFRQADSSSTKSKGGTGLGLAIAKKFIEMHGGIIGVDSTVSVGSTFWFELPVQVEQGKETP